jgi:hypothetical protein
LCNLYVTQAGTLIFYDKVGEFIHQYFCTRDPCSEFKFYTLRGIWTRLYTYNKGITVPFSELKDHQHIQKTCHSKLQLQLPETYCFFFIIQPSFHNINSDACSYFSVVSCTG